MGRKVLDHFIILLFGDFLIGGPNSIMPTVIGKERNPDDPVRNSRTPKLQPLEPLIIFDIDGNALIVLAPILLHLEIPLKLGQSRPNLSLVIAPSGALMEIHIPK